MPKKESLIEVQKFLRYNWLQVQCYVLSQALEVLFL